MTRRLTILIRFKADLTSEQIGTAAEWIGEALSEQSRDFQFSLDPLRRGRFSHELVLQTDDDGTSDAEYTSVGHEIVKALTPVIDNYVVIAD